MVPRHLEPLLEEALGAFPVATILGSRQTGKSTLARQLIGPSWPARYVSLDDLTLRAAARRDPQGFVASLPRPVVLDEVQRAPDLLLALKEAIDRDPAPGRYLLTGSANVLTLDTVSESLAGRVALFDLLPCSWAEIQGCAAPSDAVDRLFSLSDAAEFVRSFAMFSPPHRAETLADRILAGGFPVPAQMKPGRVRSRWFDSYRRTYVERDLRDLANLARFEDADRLLVMLASLTGRILNTAELARDLGLPLTTLRRYLRLLQATYQIRLVEPWFANIGKRLVKAPKVYLQDTGLACSLLALDCWEHAERTGRAGQLVETFVATELIKIAALADVRTEVYYFRTHSGREVDFLIARGDRLVGIEVKATHHVDDHDVASFERARAELGDRLGLGVILYSGDVPVSLTPDLAAVPIAGFLAGR